MRDVVFVWGIGMVVVAPKSLFVSRWPNGAGVLAFILWLLACGRKECKSVLKQDQGKNIWKNLEMLALL
jgi:hypothetical protein